MTRVAISPDVAAEVLFASARTCCVCRITDKPVQLHHIDGDHSNSVRENLAVLCLDHHLQTQVTGGFVRHLDPLQVRQFRDDWEERVLRRRDDADRLHAESMAALTHRLAEARGSEATLPGSMGTSADAAVVVRVGEMGVEGDAPKVVIKPLVEARDYISTLPELRRRAYSEVSGLLVGSTSEQHQGTSRIIDVMEEALVQLATFYPDFHFRDRSPQEFIRSQITARYQWHQFRHQTASVWGGSFEQSLTLSSVLGAAEEMITQVVASLIFDWGSDRATDPNALYAEWKADWDRVDTYPGCSG